MGAGIFSNPAVVARMVHSGALMLTAWAIGGVLALALLTAINCANLRAGNMAQSTFMVLKIGAIVSIIGCGVAILARGNASTAMVGSAPAHPWMVIGAALTSVMFAYGGWQTASFAAADMRDLTRDPTRDLSRAMLYGMLGVVALYLAINAVFLMALGADGLAATITPAAAVVDRVSSRTHVGANVISAFIALSTFGFLSQGMFATPRGYQAMAADGLFFKSIARISPRWHTPTVAIALQGTLAAIVAASGTYESIMSYVTSVDFLFYGLAAVALFVFRARARNRARNCTGTVGYMVPGHPWTTMFFMLASWTVVATTIYNDPTHSLIGIGALLLGLPTYFIWIKLARPPRDAAAGRANVV